MTLPTAADAEPTARPRVLWPELVVTALALVFFGWGLDRNGFGNAFYATAVRSMTTSWHNFFYASLDPGGWITVDKSPLAFWPAALAARAFGYSSWSVLLPSAFAGTGTVWILMATVRRPWGRAAGVTAPPDFARSDQPPGALLRWLDGQRGPAKWIVGVGSSFAAQDPIVAGYPVVASGGYMGPDGAASVERVAPLLATGKLRYLYLGGGEFGSRGGEVGRLTDAVQRSCPVVGPSVWGGESGFGATLYDCAGRAAAVRSAATGENRG